MIPRFAIHSTAVSVLTILPFGMGISSYGIWGESALAGTVSGQVVYRGANPAPPEAITVTRDAEFCGTTWTDQPLQLDRRSGGIRGAIVSIEGIPLPGNTPSPETIVISNRQCHFAPRIGAIQSTGYLSIRNDDPILHNTHIYQGKRTILNVALVPGNRLIKKRLKRPGLLLVKCDKHTFMQAQIAVFDHPYFAVTDATGHFRIPNIPPGTYTVTVWHQVLGTKKLAVVIPLEGAPTLSVEYSEPD